MPNIVQSQQDVDVALRLADNLERGEAITPFYICERLAHSPQVYEAIETRDVYQSSPNQSNTHSTVETT